MMVEARKDEDERPVADATADLSRLAQSSTRLFAEQAAVLAVMTAYGMSVAAQMTGMMLGSLRGPAEAEGMDEPAPEQKAEPAEPEPASDRQSPSATVVPLRPRASETAAVPSAKPARTSVKAPAKTSVEAKAPAKPSVSKPARRATAAATRSGKPAIARGDDLKKISGIGPRLEQVLNERGIVSYANLAALSKAALKKLDGELGLEGRIVRDDWAGQAKVLSGGKG